MADIAIHGDGCWHCRLLRKKAAIATVGFEAGLVEFDWPRERSVRIEVEGGRDYFPVGSDFVTAGPVPEQTVWWRVMAHEGPDVLRCVRA